MFLDRAKIITQPVDSLKLGRVTETRNVIQAYAQPSIASFEFLLLKKRFLIVKSIQGSPRHQRQSIDGDGERKPSVVQTAVQRREAATPSAPGLFSRHCDTQSRRQGLRQGFQNLETPELRPSPVASTGYWCVYLGAGRSTYNFAIARRHHMLGCQKP